MWLVLSLFAITLGTLVASKGDNDNMFQDCLVLCRAAENCNEQVYPTGQSLLNRLFFWDCDAECKYQCMWLVETKNRAKGENVVQYYGKWPFRRIFGIQELGSSLLSLGNLLAHWYGFNHIYKANLQGRAADWFLHGIIVLNFAVSINAWWWSTIFHARELWWTMYLDYFSAILLLFTGVALSIIRTFSIREHKRQLAVVLPLGVYFIRHVHYMAMVDFSFSWNMKVGITAALTMTLLFAAWSIAHLRVGKRLHCKYALLACAMGLAAATLEVFDFPPLWDVIDAHAIWHGATIPIILLWYYFYTADATYDLGLQQGDSSKSVE